MALTADEIARSAGFYLVDVDGDSVRVDDDVLFIGCTAEPAEVARAGFIRMAEREGRRPTDELIACLMREWRQMSVGVHHSVVASG